LFRGRGGSRTVTGRVFRLPHVRAVHAQGRDGPGRVAGGPAGTPAPPSTLRVHAAATRSRGRWRNLQRRTVLSGCCRTTVEPHGRRKRARDPVQTVTEMLVWAGGGGDGRATPPAVAGRVVGINNEDGPTLADAKAPAKAGVQRIQLQGDRSGLDRTRIVQPRRVVVGLGAVDGDGRHQPPSMTFRQIIRPPRARGNVSRSRVVARVWAAASLDSHRTARQRGSARRGPPHSPGRRKQKRADVPTAHPRLVVGCCKRPRPDLGRCVLSSRSTSIQPTLRVGSRIRLASP
jgi:hypothetical protein